MSDQLSNIKFHTQIIDVLKSAKRKVLQTVNHTMTLTYFKVGRMIVEEEQQGKESS